VTGLEKTSKNIRRRRNRLVFHADLDTVLGDHERRVENLEQACADDSQWMGWLDDDRIFDSLRGEPRFMALMKKLGFASR